QCKKKTEVWSRAVGYLRVVDNFNECKREEYSLRKKYVIDTDAL
ncbi:MAG: anaerobic ribonucleoside-triphosphate reductase, partial [Clostridia bacterium]|nr:anaerobic ribonucleoside-triphosphate reductase [Clostridia bacterium]